MNSSKVLELVDQYSHMFQPRFRSYLVKNGHIWDKFNGISDALYAKGVRREGAMGIMYYLRFHTILKERPEARWKINHNFAPDFARLYNLAHPEHPEALFRIAARTLSGNPPTSPTDSQAYARASNGF